MKAQVWQLPGSFRMRTCSEAVGRDVPSSAWKAMDLSVMGSGVGSSSPRSLAQRCSNCVGSTQEPDLCWQRDESVNALQGSGVSVEPTHFLMYKPACKQARTCTTGCVASPVGT
jgi:hypothetical protein